MLSVWVCQGFMLHTKKLANSNSMYYQLNTALPCQPAFSMTSFSKHTNSPPYCADPMKMREPVLVI